MKKKLLLSIYLGISACYFAQVGINIEQPNLSSDLHLGSTNKALLLNRVPNTAAIENAIDGMIIYDESEKCVKAHQGGVWSNCFYKEIETIFALVCSSPLSTINPSPAIKGTPYSGILSIPYTGGDGSPYPAQSIQSNGLTAVLPAGNLASGNGTLQYTVSGTPTDAVSTTFNITMKGASCISPYLTVNSPVPVFPSSITLQEGIYFVASVYDNDYAPFTAPTGPATTNRPVAADGVLDKLADYQGVIPASGLEVLIPVTATGSGTLPAWGGSTINIPAELKEDGVPGQLKLSWNAQSYTSTTKSIKATLTAVGPDLKARKLDINAGIGSDYLGILLGRFQFPSGSAGATKNYDVRILPGIPDKQIGLLDNTGVNNHNFLYLPVQGEDGNLWLNNNLGADYSNIDSPSFNITQQATSAADIKAYGSLFQLGRKPDGHELIIWTPSANPGYPATGRPVYPVISNIRIDNPTDSKFISYGGDWRINSDMTLWATASSVNNPCPSGFKVPTRVQFENYLKSTSAGIQGGIQGAASSRLKLPTAGNRNFGGGDLGNNGSNGRAYYWTSTADPNASQNNSAYDVVIATTTVAPTITVTNKAQGESVRCIKE
ncbi:MAG: fibrobacter succinogenes major paralogous domain-containing protein [Chryseobacterium sp.]|jgi:uncharacterized protein (TIGR02145 family)|uniref:FISUMP domain-containing protein n=1 Tax=Chryseobacterium sp. TaxID=1871047 RepID=UPI002834D164|nr:FISUMP domain-containing protein [Chryseobacterium sp.]MDR2238613.1 fibrobacter succinogenes major paralogous domain-containing protein [Chryseobacterium sp.]